MYAIFIRGCEYLVDIVSSDRMVGCQFSGGQITALDLICGRCFHMAVHVWKSECRAHMKTLLGTLTEATL